MKCVSRFLVLGLLLGASTAAQAAFQFTAWADNRPSISDATRANFHWVVLEMNRLLGNAPAFHVVPGDYDYTAQTDAELQANAVVKGWDRIAGNHDTDDLTMANYVTNYDNTRLIYINEYVCPAGVDNSSAGRVCEHLRAWVEQQLAGAPPFVFVVGHEPAYPQGYHIGGSLDLYPTERDAFWQLLNSRGVLAYVCGHTHIYSTYSNGMGSTMQIDLGNAGNPSHGDALQTFVLFDATDAGYVQVTTYRGSQGNPFTSSESFTLTPPAPANQAHSPSPQNGADDVPINTVLSWVSGTGASSHDVWFGAGTEATDLAFIGNQATTTYAPALAFGTSYVWRIDERYAGGTVVTGELWTFTTGPATVERTAAGETAVEGTVSGAFADTWSRDGSVETLTEVVNVPNKNGYSTLEHIWTFDVPPGSFVEFRLEADCSPSSEGDSFAFSYSTDGSTYNSMLTVTSASDYAQQRFTLPSDTAGAVYVRATDTDHTRKNQTLDSLSVDFMCIVSSQIPEPSTVTVSVALSVLRDNPPLDYGVATVTVLDGAGAPLVGALVSGHFTGAFTDAFSDVPTNAQGQAVFQSSTQEKRPSFGFDVTAVKNAGGTPLWP